MGKDVKAGEREAPTVDGSGLRVAMVCGRFNDLITNRLLDGALARLSDAGVPDTGVDVEVAAADRAFKLNEGSLAR